MKQSRKNVEFLKLAQDRFSVRDFSSRAIEEDKVQTILEAAKAAPTAVNYQPQKLYVVRTPEAVARLTSIRPLFGAPLAVIVCYDDTISWKNRRDSNHDIGEVDASIVTTHMMLQAWELGIGSCWMGAFSPEDVSKEFGIPANEHPVAILALGYAAPGCMPSERHTISRKMSEMVKYL